MSNKRPLLDGGHEPGKRRRRSATSKPTLIPTPSRPFAQGRSLKLRVDNDDDDGTGAQIGRHTAPRSLSERLDVVRVQRNALVADESDNDFQTQPEHRHSSRRRGSKGRHGSDEDHSQSEDQRDSDQSGPRQRTTRRRQNVSYKEASSDSDETQQDDQDSDGDEDTTPRTRQRRMRNRSQKQDSQDDEGEASHHRQGPVASGRARRKQSVPTRNARHIDDDEDDDEPGSDPEQHPQRRRSRQHSIKDEDGSDDDLDNDRTEVGASRRGQRFNGRRLTRRKEAEEESNDDSGEQSHDDDEHDDEVDDDDDGDESGTGLRRSRRRRKEPEDPYEKVLLEEQRKQQERRRQRQERLQAEQEQASDDEDDEEDEDEEQQQPSSGSEMIPIPPARDGLRVRWIKKRELTDEQRVSMGLTPRGASRAQLQPDDDLLADNDDGSHTRPRTRSGGRRPATADEPPSSRTSKKGRKNSKNRRRSRQQSMPSRARSRRQRRQTERFNPLDYETRRPRRARERGGGSTTEEFMSDEDDERYFQKRKQRSMQHARQQLRPLNFDGMAEDDRQLARDRQRARPIGASGADVEPMHIDTNVTFSSVGGLDHHIRSLKEMIVFPLLYPEVFHKFKVDPPRGVLFHGPPGTGKTLCARALANECSSGGRRVSFFMRKGADCLSKWVGESERMLRLLFDQAYSMRPSIIFFDEIDGLAPIRTSRQDQNYSSIVSTLLALMDGLDSRGDVVVIGATNRIDNIDPALRRPGRFDREFVFPLPSRQARKDILSIHTKAWDPPLPEDTVDALAEQTAGYCGADLRALCTEAALNALRRTFPKIYDSDKKLAINTDAIVPHPQDFAHAQKAITPAAQRSMIPAGRRLPSDVRCLFQETLDNATEVLQKLTPRMMSTRHSVGDAVNDEQTYVMRPLDPTLNVPFDRHPHMLPAPFRPRLVLCGQGDVGQTRYVAPALIALLEKYPVRTIDLASLHTDAALRTAEEACVQIIREARRSTPSIIFLSDLDMFLQVAGLSVRTTLFTALESVPADLPLLVLATTRHSSQQLSEDVTSFLGQHAVYLEVDAQSFDKRRKYLKGAIGMIAVPPPRSASVHAKADRQTEEAVEQPGVKEDLTEKEKEDLIRIEEATLRQLRMYLRECLDMLLKERKFRDFASADGYAEAPDYFDIIDTPMHLELMLDRLNEGFYPTSDAFLADIDLIVRNAYEYNPASDGKGRRIRARASDLRDHAYHLIENAEREHRDLLKECRDIANSRKRRGYEPSINVLGKPEQSPRPKHNRNTRRNSQLASVEGVSKDVDSEADEDAKEPAHVDESDADELNAGPDGHANMHGQDEKSIDGNKPETADTPTTKPADTAVHGNDADAEDTMRVDTDHAEDEQTATYVSSKSRNTTAIADSNENDGKLEQGPQLTEGLSTEGATGQAAIDPEPAGDAPSIQQPTADVTLQIGRVGEEFSAVAAAASDGRVGSDRPSAMEVDNTTSHAQSPAAQPSASQHTEEKTDNVADDVDDAGSDPVDVDDDAVEDKEEEEPVLTGLDELDSVVDFATERSSFWELPRLEAARSSILGIVYEHRFALDKSLALEEIRQLFQ